MNEAAVTEQDGNSARPPCYHCGEPYTSVNAVRHTEPVSCALPSLQRDACLLHVSEHVLRLRGAPILKGGHHDWQPERCHEREPVSGLGWSRDAGKASDGVESFGGAGPVFVEGVRSGSAGD